MKRFLLDGYNLLHGLGFIPTKLAKGELQQGRLRLLQFLADNLAGLADEVTVVFDAAGSQWRGKSQHWYRGIRVLFAQREPQADDLIEALLQKEANPSTLAVVSDDHRLQQAARRRQATPLGCAQFLEWLEQARKNQPPPGPAPPEKTERLSPEELQRWLNEFADLESDPAFKDLFDRFESDEPPS